MQNLPQPKKTKNIRAPKFKEMTIKQAAKAHPNSKACAFTLNSSPDCLYFNIGQIQRFRAGDVISLMKALKINLKDGDLVITSLPIKVMDIIMPITIKDFYDQAIATLNTLKFLYRVTPTIRLKNLIKKYGYHSFKSHRKKTS